MYPDARLSAEGGVDIQRVQIKSRRAPGYAGGGRENSRAISVKEKEDDSRDQRPQIRPCPEPRAANRHRPERGIPHSPVAVNESIAGKSSKTKSARDDEKKAGSRSAGAPCRPFFHFPLRGTFGKAPAGVTVLPL